MTRPSKIAVLQSARQVLRAFRLNWRLFLGIHISINILSLLVLTPVFSLLMGWLILASGHKALSDEDILFFVLSPTGLLVMLLAGALYATVVVFEQAAMIIAGHTLTSGQRFDLPQLSRYLLWKSWPLFQLGVQMIARTMLVSAPFLVIGVLIYQQLLSEFDINYYLSNKPAVFWWAAGLILFDLLVMVAVLLRVFSGWILALPLILLNNEAPSKVLRRSRQVTFSKRLPITLILLALFLINAGMLGLVSALASLGVDGVVLLAGDSLKVLSYLLGGLLVLWLLAQLAVTYFGNSVLSLVITYIYTKLTRGDVDGFLVERPRTADSGRNWHVSMAHLGGVALLVSLTAGLAINITMNRLNLDDLTMVVAHRGASLNAPENTLAAIELAINDGADWVEIDVQETRDGEIVVIHDSDLKKVGGVGLRVSESSLVALQSVDIGSWKDPSFNDQRIPTLQQVLALCKDRIKVVIELKYFGGERNLEASVANLVEVAGMQEQIIVMSLSYPGIRKMKSLRPDWMVGLLSSVAIGDITRLDVDFFAVNAAFTSRAFVKRVHRRNRKVMVWTVNDPISMSAMMSKGVDGIITDDPALAAKVRMERAQLETHERIMIQLASLVDKKTAGPEQ